MLKGRQKRWRVVAFVTVALVVAALLSFSSSAWATPGQTHAQQKTVKRPDVDCCEPGKSFVFEITFETAEAWHNVVVTDDLHPFLRVDNVETSHGTAPPKPYGQLVTVYVGDIPANTIVTITITCTVDSEAPACFLIYNTASVVVENPDWTFSVPKPEDDPMYIEVCCEEEFVPEAGSLLLLGSGLVGLAGYAGLRWSRYRG